MLMLLYFACRCCGCDCCDCDYCCCVGGSLRVYCGSCYYYCGHECGCCCLYFDCYGCCHLIIFLRMCVFFVRVFLVVIFVVTVIAVVVMLVVVVVVTVVVMTVGVVVVVCISTVTVALADAVVSTLLLL